MLYRFIGVLLFSSEPYAGERNHRLPGLEIVLHSIKAGSGLKSCVGEEILGATLLLPRPAKVTGSFALPLMRKARFSVRFENPRYAANFHQ
jgi:hypothetical protein